LAHIRSDINACRARSEINMINPVEVFFVKEAAHVLLDLERELVEIHVRLHDFFEKKFGRGVLGKSAGLGHSS